MQKQTLRFLVIGASLSLLLHNLSRRQPLVPVRPLPRGHSAEVIDLAAWREMRSGPVQ
jgi:hypothetical protein